MNLNYVSVSVQYIFALSTWQTPANTQYKKNLHELKLRISQRPVYSNILIEKRLIPLFFWHELSVRKLLKNVNIYKINNWQKLKLKLKQNAGIIRLISNISVCILFTDDTTSILLIINSRLLILILCVLWLEYFRSCMAKGV